MTETVDDFRDKYEQDDNIWWEKQCGDHQNLFDAACDEIDTLRDIIRALEVKVMHPDMGGYHQATAYSTKLTPAQWAAILRAKRTYRITVEIYGKQNIENILASSMINAKNLVFEKYIKEVPLMEITIVDVQLVSEK